MSILKVDTINEKTSGNGVAIPGHVVQYIPSTFATFQTRFTTTSNSYGASSYALTITPKSSTNLILISYHFSAYVNNSNHYVYSIVHKSTTNSLLTQTENAVGLGAWATLSCSASEVAGTTNAITYTIHGKVSTSGSTGYLGWSGGGYVSPSQNFNSFHLMEIAQ